MFKKLVVTTILITLIVVTGTQIGQTSMTEEMAEDDFDWRQLEGTELNILFREGTYTQALDEYLLPQFEEATGVDVNLTWLGREGWKERLYGMVMGRTQEMDVVIVHDTDAIFLASAGFLEPLDKYFEDSNLTSDLVDKDLVPEGVYEGFSYEGDIYSVPTLGTAYVQVYRKDTYSELGLTPADTWKEFLENSYMTTESHNPDAPQPYGHLLMGRAGQHLWEEFLARAWPRGGGLIDRNTGEVIIENEANLRALEQLKEETEQGLVNPDYSSFYFPDWGENFASGVASSGIVASTGVQNMRQQFHPDIIDLDEKVGVTNVPGIETDEGEVIRYAPMTAAGLSINVHSQNKDAAWLLLAFQLSRPDLILKQASISSPPVPSIYEHPDAEEIIGPEAPKYAEALNVARSSNPPIPGGNAVLEELALKISEYLAGDISAEEVLSYTAGVAEQELGN